MTWLLATATALAADWPLVDLFAEWADRAVREQVLEGVRPYRAEIAVHDRDAWFVEASMGALVADQGWRTRRGRVEVVAGSPELDSSRLDVQGELKVVAYPQFVVDDVPIAIARDLWLATDSSFKAAVKQLQLKRTALAQLGGAYPPDWSPAPAVEVVDVRPLPALRAERLRDLAVEATGRLRALGGLRNGRVEANALAGHYAYVSSEGTRVVQPEGYAVVYAWADLLREDGVQVYEYRQWVAADADALPPRDELVAEVEAMGRRVLARRDAEVVSYYEGPVVFEGDAAVDLFRYLALPEILGTPPAPRPDRTYESLTLNGPRLGRRLLQDGWSLVDDPRAAPAGLAGGFAHDRQGVAAERVEAVVDGRVRDLLTSRVPRHDVVASNGHARGEVQGGWQGRESIWRVVPDETCSDRAFDRALERARRGAGQERILVVRAFERGQGGALPNPTHAVWRAADGRETPVLGLSFDHDDRRLLRDILAAGGGEQVRPYLAPASASGVADGGSGLPAVGIAPRRLLIGELEAVFPGATVEPSVIPPPPSMGVTPG